MAECPELGNERRNSFGQATLNERGFKEILGDNSATNFKGKLCRCLKEVNVFRNI